MLAQVTKEGQPPGNAVECVFKSVRPALFLKQVVAVLASVNAPSFLDHHPDLRDYVLQRENLGLPLRYQFYLALTHPKSSIARFAGLSPLLRDGVWAVTWVTDLVWPPFGYILTSDEPAPLFSMALSVRSPIGNMVVREDVAMQLPLLVGDQPYPRESSDPVQPTGEARPFPTVTSARLPFELRLSSGESRHGEVSHPAPVARGPKRICEK